MLAFVDSHPDALERSCAEGHLTASALVVDHALERVLLHVHATIGRWLQMDDELRVQQLPNSSVASKG